MKPIFYSYPYTALKHTHKARCKSLTKIMTMNVSEKNSKEILYLFINLSSVF